MHGAIVGAFGKVAGEEVVRYEFVGVFEDKAEPEEVAVGGVPGEGTAGEDGWGVVAAAVSVSQRCCGKVGRG